jgi:hypothetical protein
MADEQELDVKGEPVARMIKCPTCDGVGILNNSNYVLPVICNDCNGSGKYFQFQMEKKLSKEDKEDKVNHPKHYTFGTIEVITVIEDWKLEFHEGNCIKYIARAKHKGNELEDLKKAQWYLNRKIKQLNNKEK